MVALHLSMNNCHLYLLLKGYPLYASQNYSRKICAKLFLRLNACVNRVQSINFILIWQQLRCKLSILQLHNIHYSTLNS